MNNDLIKLIEERIEREGPITFEQFMDMALYYREHGYYTSDRTEIGRRGDFYTSPHLHPVFGMIMARQVIECWEALNRPSDFMVIEQGAGKGYLAGDMLDYLRDKEIYGSLSYRIIEINPHIRMAQEELLNEHSHLVSWSGSTEDLSGIEGCFISNELPDSFPVHLVVIDNGLKEIYVDKDRDGFKELALAPSTNDLQGYLDEFDISLPEGYRSEINLRIKEWLRNVSEIFRRGFIVTIDYGYSAEDYYGEDRDRGTLMCYHRHQVNENPFINIGDQDITAHVNFSSMKKWGEDVGLTAAGLAGQGIYMVSMGFDEIISEKFLGRDDYQVEVAKMKGLIMPSGMGESHKVMVQYKGLDGPRLRGFDIRNRVNTL
ncbi:MAG: SAM-dependent methyltransferase [Nitrospirota bacterium]|nr:MAG: SAM-dependent methyltransferase [Nitrospirota bacterium]